jgi:hypothetical protein
MVAPHPPQVYAAYLIYLFNEMAKKKYAAKKLAVKGKDKST